MSTHFSDPWLLPTRQRDYPLRELLADERLHGRREATFLALATLCLASAITMIQLGATLVIDLGAIALRLVPELELSVYLEVPVGALVFPLSLFATAIVRELYGPRRTTALIIAATAAMVGVATLAQATASDPTRALGWSVALASGYLVAHVTYAIIIGAMLQTGTERRWLRKIIAMTIAQLCGWAAFGASSYGYAVEVLGHTPALALDQAIVMALGASVCTLAFGVLDLIPFLVVTSCLEIYLRVGGSDLADERAPVTTPSPWSRMDEATDAARPLPPALLVEDREPKPPRSKRVTLQPFSSAELRFFSEGDQLTEQAR